MEEQHIYRDKEHKVSKTVQELTVTLVTYGGPVDIEEIYRDIQYRHLRGCLIRREDHYALLCSIEIYGK